MDSRLRTLAFAVLLVGLSSLVLLQAFQTSVASIGDDQAVASMPQDAPVPLQNVNSTSALNQTFSSISTTSANGTAQNSTSIQTLSSASQSTSAMENETAAISYLQYQMTSMNDELAAMSSRMDSMSQDTGTSMLIAEAGLIVGILAIIAAIAVARRADAMYSDAAQSQSAGSPPAKK